MSGIGRMERAGSSAADRVALAARHPVPRVSLDASLSANCSFVHLALNPSMLLLGSSSKKAFQPVIPEPASPTLPRPEQPTGTWQTSLPTSKSVELRTPGTSLAEWY